MGNSSGKYWGLLPAEEIGDEIRTRIGGYYAGAMSSTGNLGAQVAWLQVLAYKYAYGFGTDTFHGTSTISRGGDQGEMNYVRMGQPRSILNAASSQATSPPINWLPQAGTWSASALRAVRTAKNLYLHTWNNTGFEAVADQCTFEASMLGESFFDVRWDPHAGSLIDLDGPVPTGDYRWRNILPWDVYRNPGKRSYDQLDDVTYQTKENRFNLAATHPDFEDAILDAPTGPPSFVSFGFGLLNGDTTWDRDDVFLLHTLFRKSATLPYGREVLSLVDGTVISDGPLPYGMWSLFRIQKAPLSGTPFGDTEFFSVLGAAEVYDSVWSTIVTNILTSGVTLFTAPRGSNVDVTALAAGLSILLYDESGGGKVEAQNFQRVPEGAFVILDKLKIEMEQALGQNAVTRGQSPGDRAPASLAALLDATSSRTASPFLKSRVGTIRDAGVCALSMFKIHVSEEMPYRIRLGAKEAPSSARWRDVRPEDIAGVDDVIVTIGQDSYATNMTKAELLAGVPDQTMRREIMEVAETGRIEPLALATEEMYELVTEENEALSRGEFIDVDPGDDDYFHVKQHDLTTMTLASRRDDGIMAAKADHFRKHYSKAFRVPLALVGQINAIEVDPMTGQPILGPDGQEIPIPGVPGADPNYLVNCQILRGQPVTPPGATMPGGAQANNAPPPDGADGPADGPAGSPPKAPSAPKPRAPHLPKSASTGVPWTPAGTGGTVTPQIS